MNRFYILLFALFTLALVGCEKEEFVFDEPMIEGSDDATTDGEDNGEDNGEETEPAPEPVKPGEGDIGDTNPEPTDPNDGQGNKKSKIIKRIAKPSPIKYPRPLAVPMD
ncbi:MAG: hypothetical protein IKK89_10875 [Alistipes sp.]|nr:hypothetical protein [Alistipes sp.]